MTSDRFNRQVSALIQIRSWFSNATHPSLLCPEGILCLKEIQKLVGTISRANGLFETKMEKAFNVTFPNS